jgi:hypothetical protein
LLPKPIVWRSATLKARRLHRFHLLGHRRVARAHAGSRPISPAAAAVCCVLYCLRRSYYPRCSCCRSARTAAPCSHICCGHMAILLISIAHVAAQSSHGPPLSMCVCVCVCCICVARLRRHVSR